MIISEVTEFLSSVPPFQFLDSSSIKNIAENVSMEYYPKGTHILQQDGPPSEYLRVIKKGAVKVFLKSDNNRELLIDYRSRGDYFGLLSLFGGDKSRANVVAAEDTICFLIQKEFILKLLDNNSIVKEFFLKSFFHKFIDKIYMEMHNKSLIYSGGDKLLFSTSVGELATKKIITASSDVSIREAAILMSSSKITSLVLVDQNSAPIGIVTDRDLRDKVVSKGRNVEDPVHAVMSVSLIKADAREYCFEALLKMIRYNIHHLLVVEGGRLKGIITNHDLMMLQGTSPVSLVKEIENSQSIDDLAPVSKKNNSIVGLLLKEGARASNITRIITEINDRLCRKILEITERKLGPSPVRYCWIVFGSEGRKEQTFKTDQDNAIIFEDVASQEEMDQARSYLSKLADAVRDALLKCGFPPCPANFMASNPQWCQPLRVWRKYFSGWLNEPTPDALLKSLVFFDFRPLYGDFHLAEQLRESLSAGIEDNTLFLGSMANTIIRNVPPIGFFKTFIVEKSGEHKNELNLKVKGIAPLIDIVRLFSLEKGVKETSTIERLRALREKHTIVEEYAEEIEHAFEFIMLLRVHSQYEQVEIGESPDNFINPDSLSNLEKRSIKEAFQLISGLQDIIIDRYKVMIL